MIVDLAMAIETPAKAFDGKKDYNGEQENFLHANWKCDKVKLL